MAEQEEMANQQQRKRLYQEVQLEKERLASTFQQKQREMEQHFASMEVDQHHTLKHVHPSILVTIGS